MLRERICCYLYIVQLRLLVYRGNNDRSTKYVVTWGIECAINFKKYKPLRRAEQVFMIFGLVKIFISYNS